VIGNGGALPWHMPSDLKTFRRLTLGKPVIMGRKTYQSIGRPLDRRLNIVISREPSFAPEGVTVVRSLAEAVALAEDHVAAHGITEIMVIGGAQIYAAALPIAGRLYLTEIDASPDGDATFPVLEPGDWREVSREAIPRSPADQFSAMLVVFEREARPMAPPKDALTA
jgi:dihydrofolate reductase